jgi:hypothetical protein
MIKVTKYATLLLVTVHRSVIAINCKVDHNASGNGWKQFYAKRHDSNVCMILLSLFFSFCRAPETNHGTHLSVPLKACRRTKAMCVGHSTVWITSLDSRDPQQPPRNIFLFHYNHAGMTVGHTIRYNSFRRVPHIFRNTTGKVNHGTAVARAA